MDGHQFDSLTRSIAQRLSRRLTFKALTAGLAAGALSQLDLEPVDAARCQSLGKSCRKRRGKPRPKCCAGSVCRGNRCQCKPNRQQCGNKCITKKQCCWNNQCPNNQRCDKKTNRCGCGKNQQRCQGRCIAKSQCCTNADCPQDQSCNNLGQCVAAACTENADCSSGVCACAANANAGVCVAPTFTQTFQNSLSGWLTNLGTTDGPATDTMSLVNGHAHVIPGDSYLDDPDPTAFSRLGGYSDVFPEGGFDVSIDVYLDPNDDRPNSGFGYTAGVGRSDNCGHRRDFGFAVGTSADGSEYCVRFSNGVSTNGNINACTGANHHAFTGPEGWYTLLHQFREDDGALGVILTLLDPDGDPVASQTLRNATDTMDIIGGHRYSWFALVTNPDGIDIRNSSRTSHD